MQYIVLYLAGISLLTIILTLYDKSAARRHKWRVRESTPYFHNVISSYISGWEG